MATVYGLKRKNPTAGTDGAAKSMKISRESMPPEQRYKIQREYSYLVEQLDVNNLTDDLYSKFIIDEDDKERIENKRKKGRKRATRKLLDIIKHRGERAFEIFLDVLSKNGYQTVKERLEESDAATDESPNSDFDLHKACHKGQLEDVKELINQGEDVNRTDSLSNTPIYYCCISQVKPVKKLKYLLTLSLAMEKPCKIFIYDLLCTSCRYGRLETVDYLMGLLKDYSGEYTRDDYETMLCSCVLSEQETVTKINLVVELSRLSGFRDITNNLLHMTCYSSPFDVVVEVLSTYPDVDINKSNDLGFNPLFYCYCSPIASLKKIHLLLSKGAKIDNDDEIDNLFLEVCKDGTIEALAELVEEGANVNCTDEYGESALLYCSRSRKDPVRKIEFLREKGAVIEHELTESRSEDEVMLCESCEYGDLETVKYFLKKGVNVNCRDSDDQTPAFYCCRSKDRPIDKLESLKVEGAMFNVTDIEYRSLLHEACYHGGVETVQHLIVNDLYKFPNPKDNCTHLFVCCCLSESGACSKLKYLLSLGNFDIKTKDDELLHLASLKGDQSVVRFLIEELHLDVNLVDEFGHTPLYMSCNSNKQPVTKTKLLISKGADLGVKYKDGDTLLHVACRFGNLSIVRHLAMKTKLNLIAENDFNETPLQHCKRSKIQSKQKASFLENEIKKKLGSVTQPKPKP